jgi:hypothetical protein
MGKTNCNKNTTQHINKAIWIRYPAEIIHSDFPATNHPMHLRKKIVKVKKINSTQSPKWFHI